MQTKRITCPNCKVVLDVKNSKNETVKQITCPSCQCVLNVKFPEQQEPFDAETYYAPPKQHIADDGATQLASSDNGATQLGRPAAKHQKIAKLLFGGIYYQLEEGRNIVGRKGCTSTATVQIDTADRYMSRQHCEIIVTTMPDGNKKVVLRNYQNKNLTTIDGHAIDTGDEIRLTDNNSITMGRTTVTFKLM